MTKFEHSLLYIAFTGMSVMAILLLAVMAGGTDPDTVRTPHMVAGMTALIAFVALHIAQWRRRKKA